MWSRDLVRLGLVRLVLLNWLFHRRDAKSCQKSFIRCYKLRYQWEASRHFSYDVVRVIFRKRSALFAVPLFSAR